VCQDRIRIGTKCGTILSDCSVRIAFGEQSAAQRRARRSIVGVETNRRAAKTNDGALYQLGDDSKKTEESANDD
jgi:hypothetical protein